MVILFKMLFLSGFLWNTYQKPYDTTTMLLIMGGVTVLLILFQLLWRKKK